MSSCYPKSVFISPDKAKDKCFDCDNLYLVYDIGRFCTSLQVATLKKKKKTVSDFILLDMNFFFYQGRGRFG